MRSRALISAWLLVGGLALTVGARAAFGIYLDEDRNVSLRTRIYSQVGIRTDDSQTDTVPEVEPGDVVQHRNFYNPELDAKLTKYTQWMKGAGFLRYVAPDEFSFRVAAWGFYDGVYDYGAKQFGDNLNTINPLYPDPASQGAFYLKGDNFRCPTRVNGTDTKGKHGYKGICVQEATSPVVNIASLNKLLPDHEEQDARDIYAHQERVNELYLSYSKGPVFFRLGRQAISWGEADTIALLDQNNPFDITRGAPGAFQDLDEARIPLWTIRTTVDLFESLGPFSSGFLEAYWVPGQIDTTTGDFPILTASPYSPRGDDPQSIIASLNGQQQFVLFDHTPKKNMGNSRYGFRFQTIIGRDHTFSVWYYTHFPNAPVPRSQGTARVTRPNGQVTRVFTEEIVHRVTGVYGISDTFFVEPLESIFRFEAEYFRNEPGFIPKDNLGAHLSDDGTGPSALDQLTYLGKVPNADFLRWELGLDRNIFIRPLNPSNSFLWVLATVGSWNISEHGDRDYYFSGQRNPGHLGTDENDFVQLKPVEMFFQTRLQTSYLHGKIEPSITTIGNIRGTYVMLPEINFRATDWLLFSIKYVHIAGAYQQIGFYRDRDQLSLRATYQLN